MTQLNGKLTRNGKFLYVEPNNINGKDNSMPLEDLCVYAEFKVEYNQYKTNNVTKDGNEYILQVKINKNNGDNKVSLYNGVTYESDSGTTFLSTEGYGNYTYDTLGNKCTEELFGVESIEVSYNSFAVPEVVVKFTDIKGAALHGAEELAHDNNGILYKNVDLTSKFLSCFFTVPYPKFELYLKGYYGKPVYYDLTCADFRSSFNSETGNYDATAKLVGYSFSLISDVTMCSILAAPYSNYGGEDYWKSQANRFMVDGVPMPTLSEIISKINGRQEALARQQEERTEEQNDDNTNNIEGNPEYDLTTILTKFSAAVTDRNKNYDFQFKIDNDFILYKIGNVKWDNNEENSNKKGVNLDSYIKEATTSELKNALSGITTENKWIEIDSDKDGYNKKYEGLKNAKNELKTKIEELNISTEDEEKLNKELTKLLGFTPNIYNISKICFAQLETFLYMFDRIQNNSHSKELFPKVFRPKTENGKEILEETWMGNINKESEEVKLIEGIIDGALEAGVRDNAVIPDEFLLDENDVKPTYFHPLDLLQDHPYKDGLNGGFKEEVIKKRCQTLMQFGSYTYLQNKWREMGIQDATIFHDFNPKGYNGIASDILSGLFTDKNLESWVQNENIIDINKYKIITSSQNKELLDGYHLTDLNGTTITYKVSEYSFGATNFNKDEFYSDNIDFIDTYRNKVQISKIISERQCTIDNLYYLGDSKNGNIFMSANKYRNLLSSNMSIEEKAYLFLHCFIFAKNEEQYHEKLKKYWLNEDITDIYSTVHCLPYYFVLMIGACYYFAENETENLQSTPFLDKNDKEKITKIQNGLKKPFIDFFTNWARNDYDKIDSVSHDINTRNTEKGKTFLINGGQNSEGYVIYKLNPEHNYVENITAMYFKVAYIIRVTNNMYGVDSAMLCEGDCKTQVQQYLEGFQNQLETLFNKEVESIVTLNSSKDVDVYEYIRFNMYRYLSQIWNRWLIGGQHNYTNWKIEDVFDNNKRIHFIDPSYNDVGKLINVNMIKFTELIQSCIEQSDIPFLSFLSYFYRDNNCIVNNVQNFLDGTEEKNIEQCFEPISVQEINFNDVKKYSDLIVLYSYQPAESQEDTFYINDNESTLPAQYKNGDGTPIPSFGVTYGMQNQNYFIDIDVSMTAPVITDQSLKAVFKIANDNYRDGASDTFSQVRSLGQDMFTVYSNHAYQCTVTMMGCAWVQPLMYFQLLNVPLFRGTYIVHKVIHSVTPNHMITKVTGTKISKLAIPKLMHPYYGNYSSLASSAIELKPSSFANTSNNCKYSYYNTTTVSSNGVVNEKVYEKLKIEPQQGDDAKLLNESATWLGVPYTLGGENRNGIDCSAFVGTIYTAVYETKIPRIANGIWKDNSNQFNKINKSDLQQGDIICFSGTVDNGRICTHVGICLGQNKMIHASSSRGITSVSYNTDYWTKHYLGGLRLKNKPVNTAPIDLQSVDGLILAFNKTLKDINGNTTNITLDKVSSDGNQAFLTVSGDKSLSFDMILQTYSSHLLELSWVITNSSNTNGLYDYILIKLRNQDNNNQFSTQVVSLTNKETFNCETISTHENLNVNFYTSIIKKYGITKSEGKYVKPNNNKIIEECKNLSSLGNVDNIINFFNEDDSIKNIEIENCDNIIDKNRIKSSGNGWDGNDLTDGTDIIDVKFDFKGDGIRGALQNKNQLLYDTKTYPKYPSIQSKPFTYVNKTESAAHWTYDNGKLCTSACCAKAVRRGLEDGSNFNTNGKPNSASRYWEYLSHWGYNQRYFGYIKDYDKTDGVYQSGDIIVLANYTEAFREQNKLTKPNHIHGHIQTVHGEHFCSYSKNEEKGIWKKNPRPCYIFRAPSNKPQLNTNSGAICSPIENNDYKPSPEIIEFIKIKEGFREKWYKCPSGNWTIGYGFQETKELRQKYPNSITKDEASIILENQKIPYFVNGLKQTMGDYFGCYNQDQLDALLDLCYNVGVNGFSKNKSPKLHVALKSHDIANILANMNHGASSYKGVRKRREENKLWFQGRKKEVMAAYEKK